MGMGWGLGEKLQYGVEIWDDFKNSGLGGVKFLSPCHPLLHTQYWFYF